MRILRLLSVVVGLFGAVVTSGQTLEIKGPARTVKMTLAELKKTLKSQTVQVDDIVYKRTMKYDAFDLREVLKLAGISLDERADELVFTAIDGYSPNMTFAQLKANQGYLAYQEHGQSGKFTLTEQGKAKISPGPFYVVWNKSPSSSEVPWPYQLAKIELVDWSKKYALVVPPKVGADSPERKGFELFKAECIRCHSINLQGGEIGPELNAPQNITEYWKPETLRAFIHEATQFRYKSKMPSFKSLSDQDLDHLLAYLGHMKNFKIPPPGVPTY